MSNSDINVSTTGAPSASFNPRSIDRGSNIREPVHSLSNVAGNQINPATEESLGTDGASAPSIAGTGVRGWLRAIFDRLAAGININNFPATQPVSATALPLPAGAATSNKQPAFGTAGTPATDILTVQGSPSMTALTVVEQAFRPIPSSTKSLNVGPTATTAGTLPIAAAGAIPAGTVNSYRIRNAASSASPVTWIVTTNNTKTPVIPTPFAADGTGGVVGDKTIDPGSVEVISLSPEQQTALAAGTLYISAVTPANGSALLSITPGFGA